MARHGGWLGIMAALALAVSGCGGPGQILPLGVNVDSVPAPAKAQTPLRVAVVPFEDARTDKSAIGRYQHYVETRVDTLVPAKGSAADQVTDFVVEYLKRAGFEAARVPAGGGAAPGSADVVLTGQIESYWNEAVGRFFRTEAMSKNRLVFTAANASNASTVRATVAGEATKDVVWFCLADLARLNSEALEQSLERFLAEVVIVDRALKPRK